MPNQDIGIRLVGEDRASGAIRNVQGALGGLEKTAGGVSSGLGAIGTAAATAAGFIVAELGGKAVSAISNLTKEMVELGKAQSKLEFQSKNLYKNLGLSKYQSDIAKTIDLHSRMTALDDDELLSSYNKILAVTKDRTRATEILSLAEDLAVGTGEDLNSVTQALIKGFEGEARGLKQFGIYLDEAAYSAAGAEQRFSMIKSAIVGTFGGAAQEYLKTSAGQMDSFANSVENLKEVFGGALVDAIAPSLKSISDVINELSSSGKLQPLIDSFSNLVTSITDAAGAGWELVKALYGAKTDEEAINSLAGTFNLLAKAIQWAADQLERLSNLINGINAGALSFGQAHAYKGPGGVSISELISNANDRSTQDITRAKQEETIATDQVTDSALQYVNELRKKTSTTKTSTTILSQYGATTQGTSKDVGSLGNAASGAAYGLERFIQSLSGGGGGGGGCRTAGSSSSSVGGAKDPWANSNVAWYNRLGNENAGIVATMGEAWAGTIDPTQIRMNSCSGKVCTFGTTTGQKYYNDNGNFVQIGGPPQYSVDLGKQAKSTNEVIDANKQLKKSQQDTSNKSYSLATRFNSLSTTSNTTGKNISSLGAAAASALSAIQSAASSGSAGGKTRAKLLGGNVIPVPDALITKRGDIVKFHPNDNILAFQDPASVRGKGGNISVTININGSGDPDRVAELIMKKIERIQRMS